MLEATTAFKVQARASLCLCRKDQKWLKRHDDDSRDLMHKHARTPLICLGEFIDGRIKCLDEFSQVTNIDMNLPENVNTIFQLHISILLP